MPLEVIQISLGLAPQDRWPQAETREATLPGAMGTQTLPRGILTFISVLIYDIISWQQGSHLCFSPFLHRVSTTELTCFINMKYYKTLYIITNNEVN